MPDSDRFRLGLSGRWLRVERSISAGSHPDQIADLVAKAAAHDLRRVGGLDGLAERTDVADSRSVNAGWTDVILEDGSVSGRHRLTLLAAHQLTEKWALTSPVTALEAFAERVISNMTNDRLDRMLHKLLGSGKLTAAEFAELREDVHRHPQMTKLREELMRHPDAAGLKAPRRTVRPRKIDDLLNAEVSEL